MRSTIASSTSSGSPPTRSVTSEATRSGSALGRSTLLRTGISSRPASIAAYVLATVCASTPWAASTTRSAPSQAARLRDTSYEKSTWPGVSIRCRWYVRPSRARYSTRTACALIVIPRSRSSSIESRTCGRCPLATAPVSSRKRSASVDLPWSMWAMIEKLRIRSMRSPSMARAPVQAWTIAWGILGGARVRFTTPSGADRTAARGRVARLGVLRGDPGRTERLVAIRVEPHAHDHAVMQRPDLGVLVDGGLDPACPAERAHPEEDDDIVAGVEELLVGELHSTPRVEPLAPEAPNAIVTVVGRLHPGGRRREVLPDDLRVVCPEGELVIAAIEAVVASGQSPRSRATRSQYRLPAQGVASRRRRRRQICWASGIRSAMIAAAYIVFNDTATTESEITWP